MKPGILLFASCILLYSGNISAQEKYSAVLKKDTLQFSDDTLVLGAGDYRGQIHWQKSADQYLWENIDGAESDSLMIRIDTCGYYRFMISEGTCQPFYSDVTQVYVKDSCLFLPEKFTGDYITILEHWNDHSGDAYYSVKVVKNLTLSTDDKLVLDITGLFTGNNSSRYRISIDLKTQLISTDSADAMVVDTDLYGWGFGRLWFEDFTAPYLSTCGGYIRFTVTPYLLDMGLWFDTSITYFIGPGAPIIRYKKNSGRVESPITPGNLHNRIGKK